jgi:uncharacterized protein YebE (UPF0316 family)
MYIVQGIARIVNWFDQVGYITMDQFSVEHIKDIPDNLNDGGYGAKAILGGWVSVWNTETHETKIYQISKNGKMYPRNNPARWPDFLFQFPMF